MSLLFTLPFNEAPLVNTSVDIVSKWQATGLLDGLNTEAERKAMVQLLNYTERSMKEEPINRAWHNVCNQVQRHGSMQTSI